MQLKRFKLVILGPTIVGIILALALSSFVFFGIRAFQELGWQRVVSNNTTILSSSSKLAFNSLYSLDTWALENMLKEFVGSADIVRAVVRDASGKSIVEITTPDTLITVNNEISQNLATNAFSQKKIVYYESDNYLVLCGPIASGSEKIGTLEIVVDIVSFHNSITRITTSMILASTAITIASVLLIILLAHNFTKQISALADASNEIGQRNLETYVPIGGPKETVMLGQALAQMKDNLNELYDNLEEQIKAQKHRASQLQATAEVAREAAAEIDTTALLQRVTDLIYKHFSFYRLAIFMVDSSGEWAEIQAAKGEDTQQLLDNKYRLRVGQEGLVGRVIQTGETYVTRDINNDPFIVHGANISQARSEIALPLQARGNILGAINVQSSDENAFSDEDITVLEILADQIGMAISNSLLFQDVQKNLLETQQAYGEISRNAWTKLLQTQFEQGYYCDNTKLTPLTDASQIQNKEELPEAVIPISVRGKVIGSLIAHKSDKKDRWSKEEVEIMESLASQLGVALDSARLYQDTQRAASQETIIREITDKVSASFSLEESLQTTIGELRTVLGASGASIKLNLSEDVTPASRIASLEEEV